ncbi:uncharacterized protein [Apostichopus japonicus]|uniref:uncharacterized protein isoform X2 n=1 Tax=Stichopus japonicus TaxID=307972 RepID=UPI003AB3BF61
MLQSLLSAARKVKSESQWQDLFQKNADQIPRVNEQHDDAEESTTCYQLTLNNIEAIHKPVFSSLFRARDEKTLPADPSLDDVSAEPQLRAHAYWMLGVIKFSEGRRPTKFPPEGGQSLHDTGSDHIFRGKKANLRQVSTRGGPNWLADFCSVLTAGL